MTRRRVPTWLLPALLVAARAGAQEPAPPAAPAPAPPQAPTVREAHTEALRRTTVHFAFRRAPLEDVAAAVERATGVPVRVGAAARRVLERRRFRIRYVADRTAEQALDDLVQAAALDAEVTDEGVVIDTREEVRRLRRRLDLQARSRRLDAEDVARALDSRRLTLLASERPLDVVLDFLRAETGVPILRVRGQADEAEDGGPSVTLSLTDEPLRVVLDRVAAEAGLAWVQQGSTVLVGPADAIAAEEGTD